MEPSAAGTIWHDAVRSGPDAVRQLSRNSRLVVRGATADATSVNVPDARGRTPLHLAAHRGNAEATRLLLAHGANPHARDSSGFTPLEIATRHAHPGVARQLLGVGMRGESGVARHPAPRTPASARGKDHLTSLPPNALTSIGQHLSLTDLKRLRDAHRRFQPTLDALKRKKMQQAIVKHHVRQRALEHSNNIRRHNAGQFTHAPNFVETINREGSDAAVAYLRSHPSVARRLYHKAVAAVASEYDAAVLLLGGHEEWNEPPHNTTPHQKHSRKKPRVVIDHIQFSVQTARFAQDHLNPGENFENFEHFYPAYRMWVVYTLIVRPAEETLPWRPRGLESRVAEVLAHRDGEGGFVVYVISDGLDPGPGHSPPPDELGQGLGQIPFKFQMFDPNNPVNYRRATNRHALPFLLLPDGAVVRTDPARRGRRGGSS